MSDSQTGFDANATALKSVVNAASNHPEGPQMHLHRPANHESTHSWLAKILPPSTLESYENKFHMGNYVIDRRTGDKSFEAMSIYVRVGTNTFPRRMQAALLVLRTILTLAIVCGCNSKIFSFERKRG